MNWAPMNNKCQFNKDQLDKNQSKTDQSHINQFGEEYEKKLIEYIDIPYFKNNPSYIEQWRRYYGLYKDPQILLLMYYKGISVYYHWMYIELARHFVRIGKAEIGHFVLEQAINSNVYDKKRLVEALGQIPKFEKKYSKYDMHCVLQQKNIKALGRIWNSYDEVYVYENYRSDAFINFELMKTRVYLNIDDKVGQRNMKINENKFVRSKRDDLIIETSYNRISEETDEESEFELVGSENTDCDEIDTNCDEIENHTNVASKKRHSENDNKAKTDNKNQAVDNNGKIVIQDNKIEDKNENKRDENVIQDNKIEDDKKVDEIEDKNENKRIEDDKSVNKNVMQYNNTVDIVKTLVESGEYNIFEISGDLELNREIVINEYVHLIQEIGDTYYISLRIAKEVDITETILGKTFCLKKIRHEELRILKEVREWDFCVNGLYELFVIFECDRLENLEKILGSCDAVTAGYYLSRVLEIVCVFLEHGYILNNSVYWVDLHFEILLMDFDVSKHSKAGYEKMIVELDGLFGKFGYQINEGTIKGLSEKINEILKTTENKKKILKHKADILNSI